MSEVPVVSRYEAFARYAIFILSCRPRPRNDCVSFRMKGLKMRPNVDGQLKDETVIIKLKKIEL